MLPLVLAFAAVDGEAPAAAPKLGPNDCEENPVFRLGFDLTTVTKSKNFTALRKPDVGARGGALSMVLRVRASASGRQQGDLSFLSTGNSSVRVRSMVKQK